MEIVQAARNISACKWIRNLFLASSLFKEKAVLAGRFSGYIFVVTGSRTLAKEMFITLQVRSSTPPHPTPTHTNRSVTNDQILVCVLAT
jgi:hypothetical protein